MVTYYRGPTALITDRTIEVWYPCPLRFAIAELDDVTVVRGAPDPLAVGTTRVAGVSGVLAAVMWPFLHSPASWLVTLALVAVPVAVSGACWRLNHREWELHATYRGYRVRLFRSRDSQLFGQVRRGLMRAMEAHVGT
jgi:hypothetical protein